MKPTQDEIDFGNNPRIPEKFWELPDFPKHEKCCDGWNGPNSDPDHCVDRCTEKIEWFKNKIVEKENRIDAIVAAYRAKCDELEALRTALDEQHYYETDCSGCRDNIKTAKAALARTE